MDDPNLTYEKCALRHFGPWMIELVWLENTVAALKAGHAAYKSSASSSESIPYQVDENIAIVPIWGQIMKGPSKYGGTNSLEVRRILARAERDDDVHGIMLHVDSPGGTVAGTPALADAVAKSSKPIVTYVDDLCASAAYWIATQSNRIVASPTSDIGSIGTVAVIRDTSGQAAMDGVKVHVIRTGPYKALGMPGEEITPDHLQYIQEKVDEANEFFLNGVARGRRRLREEVNAWASGKTFKAEHAMNDGMIDAVGDFGAAVDVLRGLMAKYVDSRNAPARERLRKAAEMQHTK